MGNKTGVQSIKKLKVLSVVGARPNFMKVAPIHRAFQQYADKVDHMIVHTGQHYDANMSDAFFNDLDMPQPDFFLGIGSGSHSEQTAKVMIAFEKICNELKPDLVIVVGDVNSTLACSITAVKAGIRVAHVEGGLRSFDRTMPEEINRIVTDSICDYCFITERSAKDNLIKEGFGKDKIIFVGNTMIDSMLYAKPKAEKSNILETLGLKPREFILATLHRPSNVDEPENLEKYLVLFSQISDSRRIVLPMHPRTRKNLKTFGLEGFANNIKGLYLIDPLGYVDFLSLMMNCDFVLTDSGGIQEETTALGIPCLTVRTTTERPVTIDEGTNILVNPELDNIIDFVRDLLNNKRKKGKIPDLWDGKAGERIASQVINLFK